MNMKQREEHCRTVPQPHEWAEHGISFAIGIRLELEPMHISEVYSNFLSARQPPPGDEDVSVGDVDVHTRERRTFPHPKADSDRDFTPSVQADARSLQ
jgi:hypothetical protein